MHLASFRLVSLVQMVDPVFPRGVRVGGEALGLRGSLFLNPSKPPKYILFQPLIKNSKTILTFATDSGPHCENITHRKNCYIRTGYLVYFLRLRY